jgi:hypothetical protein
MYRKLVLVITLPPFSTFLSAQANNGRNAPQTNTNYQVTTSNGTAPSPAPPVWLDLSSLPTAARQQLLPLYQQEYALLQQLNAVKWQALQDTFGGLAAVGAATVVAPSAASGIEEDSAARAGQYGAKYQGTNAALDAQSPAEMYQSVTHGMDLITRIDMLEKEISRVRKSFSIAPSANTPWDKRFPGPRKLTPEEVKALLTPAAKAMVPAPCSHLVGNAADILQACMNVACMFNPCDPAQEAQCQRGYGHDLSFEQKMVSGCAWRPDAPAKK